VNCVQCDCPLVLLWRIHKGQRRGLERRVLCVRCHGVARHHLAVPCVTHGCVGEAEPQSKLRVCRNCRICKQRAANKASYEKHKQERLEQRKVRRLREGDQIREADRKRYVASKEKVRSFAKSPATLEEMA